MGRCVAGRYSGWEESLGWPLAVLDQKDGPFWEKRKSRPIALVDKRLFDEVGKNDTLIVVGETGSGKTTHPAATTSAPYSPSQTSTSSPLGLFSNERTHTTKQFG
ncbi:hypothetical protein ZWY2020_025200 [Hordeum vulgare]|nr:hypothetical protein ZWY2020_025200 [Hordeum vulgare]